MPAYQTSHIAVLFHLLFAKAKRTPNSSDFSQLSDEICETCKNDLDITPRYLNDKYKALLQALRDQSMSIDLKPAYMDALCHYAGYRDHNDFQISWDKIIKHVNTHELNSDSVELFISEKDREYFDIKLADCFYPGQDNRVNLAKYGDDLQELFKKMNGSIVEGKLVVWCLPQESITENEAAIIRTFFQNNEQIANLIPLFPEDTDQPLKDGQGSLREPEHFMMVVAIANHLVLHPNLELKKEVPKKAPTIETGSVGQFVQGNVSIKGKNVSLGDMTINITKNHSK